MTLESFLEMPNVAFSLGTLAGGTVGYLTSQLIEKSRASGSRRVRMSDAWGALFQFLEERQSLIDDLAEAESYFDKVNRELAKASAKVQEVKTKVEASLSIPLPTSVFFSAQKANDQPENPPISRENFVDPK